MKKMNVKRLVAIAGTMAMVVGMTACGSTDGSNANASASGSNVEVSEENT